MKNNDAGFYTASVHVNAGLDEHQAGSFYELAPEALSFSCRKSEAGGLDLLWTFDHRPDPAFLAEALRDALGGKDVDIEVQPIDPDRNWLAESFQSLPPFTVGPFFIYGSHFEDTPPQNAHPLLIDAATAFGSGEHGTTSACLLALDHLERSGFRPGSILDMGCGSGILAIAAARLWPAIDVLAADNDPECVVVTQRHVAANRTANINVVHSDGYAPGSPVWPEAPFDLIIANILAAPLIDMAAEQSRALASSGYLILSGTLAEQADKVVAAYRPYGLRLVELFPGGEWMTMLLTKEAASA